MTARWQDTALAECLADWTELVDVEDMRGRPHETLVMTCRADGSARSAVVVRVGWIQLHPHPAARYRPGVALAILELTWHRGAYLERPRRRLFEGWTIWVLVDASWIRERYR